MHRFCKALALTIRSAGGIRAVPAGLGSAGRRLSCGRESHLAFRATALFALTLVWRAREIGLWHSGAHRLAGDRARRPLRARAAATAR